MNTIVQRKYFLETTPIRVVDLEHGGKRTEMHALQMRVVDCYTGLPVGMVAHTNKKFQAIYFLADKKKNEVNEIDGEWGPRFDQASLAVWNTYNKSLPLHDRVRRWVWRWLAVGWLLIGTVLGGLTSFLVNILVELA